MTVKNEQLEMLSMDTLTEAAACLKIMAHPIRLRIVDILIQGAFPVYKIAQLCEVKPHQVCEHLRLMQSCGYLASERSARAVYYKILSPSLPSLIGCIRANCPVQMNTIKEDS